MNETHIVRKLGGDKIALLGLFAVALLVARFLVVSRSAIVLSEPVHLSNAGLAVSMPSGNGWRSDNQWTYRDNVYSLNSIFMIDRGKATAGVRCQYHLTALQATPQSRFEHQAFAVGGVVVETGQMRAGSIIIDWARIDNPEILLSVILGTARLAGDRQFDIEVYQVTGDAEMAERVFKRIVESLQLRDSQMPKQEVI